MHPGNFRILCTTITKKNLVKIQFLALKSHQLFQEAKPMVASPVNEKFSKLLIFTEKQIANPDFETPALWPSGHDATAKQKQRAS